MKMRHLIPAGLAALLISLGAFSSVGRADDGDWKTDFEAAKTQAKAEDKLMLVDFTGSDWCGFCIKLHDEVFSKDAFKNDAAKKFVLVELDFPHEKKLPDELKAQNEKLGKEYKVNGYPTVCLMDAEGQVVAKFVGFGPGSGEKYLARLVDVPNVWQAVLKMKSELDGATGIDRAKLLDQLVDAYEKKLSNPIDELQAWGKEITELDADNAAGLKNKYVCRGILEEAETLGHARKFADAVAALEKALALDGIHAEQKQEVLFQQGMFQFQLKDFAAALDTMKKASEAAADTELTPQIKGRLNMFTMVVQRQADMAKDMESLEKTTGIDRAKLLDKLIEANKNLMMYGAAKATPVEVNKWTAEIIEIDADNTAGLKSKYEFGKYVGEAMTTMRERKFEESLAAVEKALAVPGIKPDQTQEALMVESQVYLMQKDFDKCIESCKKAIEAAPQGLRVALLNRLTQAAEQQKAADAAKKGQSKTEEKK
jgi:thioredoxin-related protein